MSRAASGSELSPCELAVEPLALNVESGTCLASSGTLVTARYATGLCVSPGRPGSRIDVMA